MHSTNLGRIERGQRATSPVVVSALLDLYNVPADEENPIRPELLKLAGEARKRGVWQQLPEGALGEEFREYVDLEAEARELRTYAAELLPGLLQTEAYASAIRVATLPTATDDQTATWLDLRAGRQRRLKDSQPVLLWAVLSEAALRRQVGGAAMAAQLRYLVDLGAYPNVQLQVLPFSAGAHGGMDGAFTILEFLESDPDVVYVESRTQALYLEETEVVATYADLYGRLMAQALSPDDSERFIRRCAVEMEKK
jgi:Domain of unknown function (DUF5753)